MSQPRGADTWSETAPNGAAPAVLGIRLIEDGGEYVPAVADVADAEPIDWHGDGAEHEVLITSSPYVIIDNAGTLEVAASGTAAAILIDDGAGGLTMSTDLTAIEAGAFYLSVLGSVVAARFDASRVRFVRVRSVIRSYETN